MDMNNETDRILVVDDNQSIHEDFRKILANGVENPNLAEAKARLFGPADASGSRARTYVLDTVPQGQQAVAKVNESLCEGRPYAMAFVDMRMPNGWDGMETIRRVWQSDPRVQIVLCTAYSDYSMEHLTDELGPGDRLLLLKKPFDAVEVQQMAQALVEKWHLARQAEMKLAELDKMVRMRTAEIHHMSLHDKLTGLPNRTLLMERIGLCFDRKRRHSDYKFALLFLDFDHFKLINDSLGHEAGDLLLVDIARRLREAVRSVDAVCFGDSMSARLGGDEFIILLDDLQCSAEAARVAERLLGVLHAPYDIKGQKVHTSASIGITSSDLDYENASDMLRDSDTAMYRAKAAGRGNYVMFNRKMHEEASTKLLMEGELRSAISESQFFLQYQPIYHTKEGVKGFESLVRWRHPKRGILKPIDFIPLAEELGLIVQIDFMAIREACIQLRKWQKMFPRLELTMNSNISRRHLQDASLSRRLGMILQEAGIRPGSFCLEVTESGAIAENSQVIRTIEEIRQAGIKLYLDDFGTGHSSFSCLPEPAFRGLKIDKSFIHQLNERKETEIVLKAVLDAARALKMDVIAEGVETPVHAEILQSLNCDKVQGYLFSHPLDVGQAEALLKNASQEL